MSHLPGVQMAGTLSPGQEEASDQPVAQVDRELVLPKEWTSGLPEIPAGEILDLVKKRMAGLYKMPARCRWHELAATYTIEISAMESLQEERFYNFHKE